MAKPSIFSKEYERKMRRRKRTITLVVVLSIAAFGILYASGGIKGVFKNKNISLAGFLNKSDKTEKEDNKQDNKQEDKKPSNEEDKKPDDQQNNAETEQKNPEEKGYEVNLKDGTKIKAVYENKDGANRFKYITPADAAVTFSVNPSGTSIVILDSKAQNMILVDSNGTVQEITSQSYKSNGKDAVLSQKPEFVWCTSPKFVDDENIAYLSQLPHISSKITKKFLWVVNTKNKDKHINKYSISGENIKLGNIITDKGMEVILDDNSVKYIKVNNGSIKISQ